MKFILLPVFIYLFSGSVGAQTLDEPYSGVPADLKFEQVKGKAALLNLSYEGLREQIEKSVIQAEHITKLQNDADNPAVIIDVRSPEEYEQWHIKDSRNLYFQKWIYEDTDNFALKLAEALPDKSTPIILYCNFAISPAATPAYRPEYQDGQPRLETLADVVMEAAKLDKAGWGRDQPTVLLPRSRIAAGLLNLFGYQHIYHVQTHYNQSTELAKDLDHLEFVGTLPNPDLVNKVE